MKLLLALVLSAGCRKPPVAESAPLPLSEKELGNRFVIAHTNDIHAQFRPSPADWIEDRPDVGGLVAISAEIEALEATWGEERILVLDAGDLRTGTPLDEYPAGEVQGGVLLEMLAALGTEAWVLGNHDFDDGMEAAEALVRASPIPVVSANLDGENGAPIFSDLNDSIVVEVGGNRVGIVGITTSGISRYVLEDVSGMTVVEPKDAFYVEILRLKGKVDVLVALTHIGFEEDLKLAQAVPDIDLIVGAHSHTRMEEPQRIGKTWIVQAGCCLQGLGVSIVTPLPDATVDLEYRLVHPDPAKPIGPPSASVQAFASHWGPILDRDWGVVLGQNEYGLLSRSSREESTLGRWTCETIRLAAGADVGVYNTTGLRADLGEGPVTREDLYAVFPFGNDLVVATVSGDDLVALAIRNASAHVDPEHGRLAQQDGLVYTWRERMGTAEIGEVRVGGALVDPGRTYTVATNEFVAEQWTRYLGERPGATRSTGRTIRDVVEERVRAEGIRAVPEAGSRRLR